MPDASVTDLTVARGKITFAAPPFEVTDFHVEVDGRTVPLDALSRRFSVEVGEHLVVAEGTVDGGAMAFATRVTVHPGDLVLVPIALEPASYAGAFPELPRCVLEARDNAEVEECIDAGRILHHAPPKHGCGACTSGAGDDAAPLASLPVILFAVACFLRLFFRRGRALETR